MNIFYYVANTGTSVSVLGKKYSAYSEAVAAAEKLVNTSGGEYVVLKAEAIVTERPKAVTEKLTDPGWQYAYPSIWATINNRY
jgi:uncharacterized protein YbjT (DUF2867 family)